jgi:hypothetical protein
VSDPAAKNNNARAKTRCNNIWPLHTLHLQECDEYPFASAGNRSADSDSKRDLSLCAMPGGTTGPNYQAGKALKRFYDKDRVLHEQNYFNRFNTELTNPEPMATLCWDNYNETSQYLTDKPQD